MPELMLIAAFVATSPPSVNELEREALAAIRASEWDRAKSIAERIASEWPEGADAQTTAGELLFRAGEVEASVEAFDRAVRLRPAVEPYLWQRGIAQYLAGDFPAGARQFESHRHVNPHDVENAAWHLLCVAREHDFETARRRLLEAPGDSRVPMKEVYELYAGTGSVEAVQAAANRLPEGTPRGDAARFYADLYLGLYYEAADDPERALRYLRRAVAHDQHHYMADVARVHLERRSTDP